MNFSICSKCKKRRPVSMFSPDKKNKSGLRSNCKPCSLKAHKLWVKRNPEKMAEAKRSWNKRNPDKVLAQKRRSREVNGERINALCREWRRKNKLKMKATNCNSKARLRFGCAPIKNSELVSLLLAADGKCSYCGSFARLSFDHKVPLSKGGEHSIENIAIACVSCNSRKGSMRLDEFIEKQNPR